MVPRFDCPASCTRYCRYLLVLLGMVSRASRSGTPIQLILMRSLPSEYLLVAMLLASMTVRGVMLRSSAPGCISTCSLTFLAGIVCDGNKDWREV
jgi:hypothetical protein